MLNLKFKLPLLALSISTALIAPQIVSAAPIKILALGDSITNGIYNGGNALSYRDDLHLLLKAGGYSYEYLGKCPNDSGGDETGECTQASLYSPGVVDEPATSGVVFSHEGRAGKHADYFNENGRLQDLLTSWYYPEAIFLHIGTNDIYQQENDVNKNDTVVEEITYTTTLADIETMVNTIKGMPYAPKIYLAKILPIGRVSKNGVDSAYTGAGGDAAKRLNQLLQTKYGNDPKVTLVSMNKETGFTYAAHMSSDKVHPKGAGELKMAQRWFAKFKLDFAKNGADKTKSTLLADKSTATANDEDFTTVTFQAKDSNGDNLTTGGDSVEIYTLSGAVTVSSTIDNGDGTYTATVKRNKSTGIVSVRAKLNGAVITATVPITFIPAQTIAFNPPLTMGYAEEKVLTDVASLKFGTTTPTDLKVLVEVDSTSSAICVIDADNKLVIKPTANISDKCKLNASQAGGTKNGVTYGAATTVTKEITVVKGGQIISFDANTPSTGFVGEVFAVKAVSTSGLNVAFTAIPSSICSIDSNAKVTLKAAGTCKVTASQAGNAKYKVAPLSFANITVSNDKVTLATIADKTFGVKPFAVTATSSAGAAVTLTATPAKVCTVSGKTVTVVGAGTCKLTAKTAHGTATTTFAVKKNASQLAIDTVAKVINGSGSITVAQLEPIKGLKNLKLGRDYTKAIKAGTYADPSNPTVAELQKAVDKANSDANKSGGSTSPLWLLTLGFIALFRRKAK